MSQLVTDTINTEWTDIEDLITVTASTLYFIQNRGPFAILACEGDSEPTTDEGIVVPPYATLKYEQGTQKLYLKTLNGKCAINISQVG